MPAKIKRHIKKPGLIREVLGLESTYRIGTRVEGRLNKTHTAVVAMTSGTAGKVIVYGLSLNWESWTEIPQAEFHRIASAIISES